MKYFVRPVMMNLYGLREVNMTVSPIMYRHSPQEVLMSMA